MQFCNIYSGSSGNCIYAASGKTKILIDAGLTGKKIQEGLMQIGVSPDEINAIVITHEHDDHIKSAGILSRRFNIPIYANTNTWNAMINHIGNIKEENTKVFDHYNAFAIGDLYMLPFPIPHDAAEPCGYTITDGKKRVSVATDMGQATKTVKENIMNSDIVLLESNHDVEMLKVGPYPYPLKLRILSNTGHLSNEDAGKTIVELLNGKVKKVILGHLSKTNNYPELALRTVISILEMNDIRDGEDIDIDIALRDKVGKLQII